jgi:hypothetical protein
VCADDKYKLSFDSITDNDVLFLPCSLKGVKDASCLGDGKEVGSSPEFIKTFISTAVPLVQKDDVLSQTGISF